MAVMHNNAEVAQTLLAAGANPNISDLLGRTPLMVAAARGLVRGVGVELYTYMHVYVQQHTYITGLVTRVGVQLCAYPMRANDLPPSFCSTIHPVSHSLAHSFTHSLALLKSDAWCVSWPQALILLDLVEAGADPSRKDYEGRTALYEACRTGGSQAIEVLMVADAQ
jgi:ankyrin repeat protein